MAQFVSSEPVHEPSPSKQFTELDAHVVQTLPSAHVSHPGYAVSAAAHFFFGPRHGVLVDVSHCVQALFASHWLPALQPVEAWHDMPSLPRQ